MSWMLSFEPAGLRSARPVWPVQFLLEDKGILRADHWFCWPHKSPEKVWAIVRVPAPTSVGQPCFFLGVINDFGQFVADLFSILLPLNVILCKGRPQSWTTACKSVLQVAPSSPLLVMHALWDGRGHFSCFSSVAWKKPSLLHPARSAKRSRIICRLRVKLLVKCGSGKFH